MACNDPCNALHLPQSNVALKMRNPFARDAIRSDSVSYIAHSPSKTEAETPPREKEGTTEGIEPLARPSIEVNDIFRKVVEKQTSRRAVSLNDDVERGRAGFEGVNPDTC